MVLDAMKMLLSMLFYPVLMAQNIVLLEYNGYEISLFSLILAPIVVGLALTMLLIIAKGGTSKDDD